jgi:hypothetical protein
MSEHTSPIAIAAAIAATLEENPCVSFPKPEETKSKSAPSFLSVPVAVSLAEATRLQRNTKPEEAPLYQALFEGLSAYHAELHIAHQARTKLLPAGQSTPALVAERYAVALKLGEEFHDLLDQASHLLEGSWNDEIVWLRQELYELYEMAHPGEQYEPSWDEGDEEPEPNEGSYCFLHLCANIVPRVKHSVRLGVHFGLLTAAQVQAVRASIPEDARDLVWLNDLQQERDLCDGIFNPKHEGKGVQEIYGGTLSEAITQSWATHGEIEVTGDNTAEEMIARIRHWCQGLPLMRKANSEDNLYVHTVAVAGVAS